MISRTIPMLIVFLSGLAMLLDYYFPRISHVHGIREIFLNWGRIGLSFAMILGIVNLLLSSFKKVILKNQGWIYSLILLAGFAVTFYYAAPYHVVTNGSTVLTVKGTDLGQKGFEIFRYVYTPLSATIFALVAFFIASAAFRAFRAKNVEACLLLVSAIVVMLGSIPLGDDALSFTHLDKIVGPHLFSVLSNLTQEIPMSAAQRAINIGVAIGMISMSIKILGGIDRSYFGGE